MPFGIECDAARQGRRARAGDLAADLHGHPGAEPAHVPLRPNLVRAADRVFLRFTAAEMKTAAPLELELPVDTIRLLDAFLKDHRGKLAGAAGPYLFPGPEGGARSYSAMREAVSAPLRKHAGITLSPHLYRHTSPRSSPSRAGNLDRSAPLGHKSITRPTGVSRDQDPRGEPPDESPARSDARRAPLEQQITGPGVPLHLPLEAWPAGRSRGVGRAASVRVMSSTAAGPPATGRQPPAAPTRSTTPAARLAGTCRPAGCRPLLRARARHRGKCAPMRGLDEERTAPRTVASSVIGLKCVLRRMNPERDWRWLMDLSNRLDAGRCRPSTVATSFFPRRSSS